MFAIKEVVSFLGITKRCAKDIYLSYSESDLKKKQIFAVQKCEKLALKSQFYLLDKISLCCTKKWKANFWNLNFIKKLTKWSLKKKSACTIRLFFLGTGKRYAKDSSSNCSEPELKEKSLWTTEKMKN